MISSPATAAGSNNSKPLGQVPAAIKKPSHMVQVVNPILNGADRMKHRKDAAHYVSVGRAEWLYSSPDNGQDSADPVAYGIRLLMSHPANQKAQAEAAQGYEMVTRTLSMEELKHISMVQRHIAYTDCSVPVTRHGPSGRSGPVRVLFSATPK